jgi:hypothetical protein
MDILVRKFVELDLGFPIPDTSRQYKILYESSCRNLPDLVGVVRDAHDRVKGMEDHLKRPSIVVQRSSVLAPRILS